MAAGSAGPGTAGGRRSRVCSQAKRGMMLVRPDARRTTQATALAWKESRIKGYVLAGSPVYLGSWNVPAAGLDGSGRLQDRRRQAPKARSLRKSTPPPPPRALPGGAAQSRAQRSPYTAGSRPTVDLSKSLGKATSCVHGAEGAATTLRFSWGSSAVCCAHGTRARRPCRVASLGVQGAGTRLRPPGNSQTPPRRGARTLPGAQAPIHPHSPPPPFPQAPTSSSCRFFDLSASLVAAARASPSSVASMMRNRQSRSLAGTFKPCRSACATPARIALPAILKCTGFNVPNNKNNMEHGAGSRTPKIVRHGHPMLRRPGGAPGVMQAMCVPHSQPAHAGSWAGPGTGCSHTFVIFPTVC